VLTLAAPVPQSVAGQSLTISSFGLSAQELVALFTSVGIDDDRPQLVDDRPVFLDPALLDGMVQLTAGTTDGDLLTDYLWGGTTTSTLYQDAARTELTVVATSPNRYDAPTQLGALATTPVPAADPAIPDLQLGTTALAGDSTGTVARWSVGATTIRVYSTLPPEQLLPLLPTLRHTTPREWDVAKRRAAATAQRMDVDGTDAAVGHEADLATGVLGSGVTWSARLRPPSFLTIDLGRGSSFSWQVGRALGIRTLTTQSMTIVSALVDPGSAAVAMRVTVAGQALSDAPLLDLATLDTGGSLTGRVGAFVFDQSGPFTVELLDQAGAVVDSFTSPDAGPSSLTAA
jgi:hypothetical protein